MILQSIKILDRSDTLHYLMFSNFSKLIIVLILISLFAPKLVVCETDFGGTIDKDSTLTLANSPYVIVDSTLIVSGVTLTIEPGVTLRFDDGKYLKVEGDLVARGTVDSNIVFTSNSETPSAGSWSKVWLNGTSVTSDSSDNYTSGTVLEYCQFLYAVDGLQLSSSSCIVDNCLFEDNTSGMRFQSGSNSIVRNSVFRNNGSGVACSQGTSNNNKFISNLIYANTGSGLTLGGYKINSANNTFRDNRIWNNGGYGMSFGTGNVVSGFVNNLIVKNTVYSNGGGIHVSDRDNVIRHNIIFGNGTGLSTSHGDDGLVIASNVFYDNTSAMVFTNGWYGGRIDSNQIISNGSAIQLGSLGTSYYPHNFSFSYNTINVHTKSPVVEILQASGIVFNNNNFPAMDDSIFTNWTTANVNAENNYWWDTTSVGIGSLIYDYYDDFERGIVDYTPYLDSLNTGAPILPPRNLVKSESGSDVQLSWAANEESDLVGYKVYYGSPTGYSFANVVDVGNTTSYTLAGASISDTIAVTAYDAGADGTNDKAEGHESWFKYADLPTPGIFFSSTSLDFGSIVLDQSSQQTFSILNNGTSDLTVSDIVSSNSHYTATPTSFTVSPGNEQIVTVEFIPTVLEIESGTLSVSHNAIGGSTSVNLFGIGVPAAGTGVRGVIETSATWSTSGSPYYVVEDLLVPSWVTLTIEPGVTLRFDDGKYLKVEGDLVARGTVDSNIVFTSNSETPSAGSWSKVWLNGTSVTSDSSDNYTSGTVLEYCQFLYAVDGLQLSSSSCIVDNCLFEDNTSGMRFQSGSNSIVRNSVFRNNGSGVACSQGTSNNNKFISNLIYANTGSGLTLGGYKINSANNTFRDNRIWNNGGYGMSFGTGNVVSGFVNNLIVKNTVYSNGGGIHVSDRDNVIRHNIIFGNGTGLSTSHGDDGLVIASNVFYDNTSAMVFTNGWYGGRIDSNQIISNGSAIQLGSLGTSYYPHNFSFSYNTINVHTKSPVVEILQASGIVFNNNNFPAMDDSIFTNWTTANVNAENNYWWDTTSVGIGSLIYDYYDDFERGIVDYTPYLDSLNTGAPILPPRNLVKSESGSDVQLSWAANEESDLVGYKVYYGSPTGYSFANVVDVGNTTSYTLAGASISDTIAVTAYDAGADGTNDKAEGHESWFKYAKPPPEPPSNLSITAGNQQITLNWSANTESDLNKYYVYRDTTSPTNSLIDSIIISAQHETIYVDTSVVIGQRYYYRITAVNIEGVESNFSPEVSAVPTLLVTVSLNQNWNLVSWDVDTENDSVSTILSEIINNVIVVLGFEGAGLTYDPSWPQLSTLQELDHLHGYWMKTSEATQLSMSGVPVQDSLPLPLDSGWNVISYLPNARDSVTHALESILDNVIVVLGFESAGLTYDPDWPQFSNLRIMSPGYGYWVKLDAADTLIYPDDQVAQGASKQLAQSSQESDVIPTTEWINIFGEEIVFNNHLLEKGSVIQAKDPDGVICGQYLVELEGRFGMMPIYRDDPTTEGDEGAEPGDEIGLYIDGYEVNEKVLWSNLGAVSKIGINPISSVLPTEYAVSQNYPNPFNPFTNIQYQLPRANHLRLTIYNIRGEEVRTLVDDRQEAGYYSIKWDGTNNVGEKVASGIYLYKMTAGKFMNTKKMILLK